MKKHLHLLLKAMFVAVPTYGTAFLTEAMVYTIPTLVVTLYIVSNLGGGDQQLRVDEGSAGTGLEDGGG